MLLLCASATSSVTVFFSTRVMVTVEPSATGADISCETLSSPSTVMPASAKAPKRVGFVVVTVRFWPSTETVKVAFAAFS